MIAAGLITFREGLEAALIVGILVGYLRKTGASARSRYAWMGVAAAVAASIALAIVLQIVGAELEGRAEQVFEGVMMFLAVGILTWMIFWMRKQSRSLKSSLENEMQTALGGGHNRGIFMVAFLAVFREGVETALFLSAAAFTSDGMSTLLGAVVGLVAAVLVGYLVYASTVRLNMRLFFDVTAVLLLAFAAGLFARGIHEFQEASLLPFLMQQAWNTNLILEDTSTVGLILRAAFGYNGAPSLLEVIGYWLYWIVTLFGVRWWVNRKSAQRAVPAHA